jgi:hypothetical protein
MRDIALADAVRRASVPSRRDFTRQVVLNAAKVLDRRHSSAQP